MMAQKNMELIHQEKRTAIKEINGELHDSIGDKILSSSTTKK